MSVLAHFFVVVCGSLFHERLAHFFVDIYKGGILNEYLTNKGTKKVLGAIIIIILIVAVSWLVYRGINTETTSIKELNELLNTKEWIAIAAVDTAPITYVLGRINLEEIEKLA